MNKEDFTEDELKMLKVIFKGAEAILEAKRIDNYDVDDVNTFYYLKQKLGIYDLIEDL